MRIIVGLRNPGREYAATRHNVGAEAVASLAESHQASWRRRPLRSRSETAGVRVGGERVLLGLPLPMMNVSGGPVGYLVKYNRAAVEDLLVVHDDIDLPLEGCGFAPAGVRVATTASNRWSKRWAPTGSGDSRSESAGLHPVWIRPTTY